MREQILAVQRMQDYIEENFESTVSLAQLSRVSYFSPWYSYRLFRAYTGFTPSEYARRLKLSRSAMRLKNGDCRIIDAALDVGFGSPDGYTRAFFKEFGINPKEYAERKSPITLFVPYGVKFRELRKEKINMENLRNVFVQAVHKDARKAIIKRGVRAEDYFAYCEEVGCDVWGTLLSMDSLCGEPVCLWLTERCKKPNTSTYVQGVEVKPDYSGEIPDGFDVIELPEADYLMFRGEPFNEEDYCEAITALQEAMNRYEPSVIGYEWDECVPRIQLEPRGERGYIEMRGVRKKKQSRGGTV